MTEWMKSRIRLDDLSAPFAADASVVINLIATGVAQTILDALPNRFVVTGDVVQETGHGRRQGRRGNDTFAALVETGRAEIVALDVPASHTSDSLTKGVFGKPLGNGEASTIAWAAAHDAVVLVDERAANQVCARHFGALAVGSSVGMLAHDAVGAALGRAGLADAVFNALRHGRMQVPSHSTEWVVEMIGPERAVQCRSLPERVRRRFE